MFNYAGDKVERGGACKRVSENGEDARGMVNVSGGLLIITREINYMYTILHVHVAPNFIVFRFILNFGKSQKTRLKLA